MLEFETPLCTLAYKYGSDKCPQIKHFFTVFYYDYFKDRRDQVRKVLEIGVGDAEEMRWTKVPDYQTGASLKMWRDFFPQAQIYGADIKPNTVFKADRIETFLCNQTKAADLQHLIEKTGSDLDIVIDDGTHIPQDQIFTCKTLMPLLNRRVTYFIEDVGHANIVEQLADYDWHIVRHSKLAWKDDRLVIVKHK